MALAALSTVFWERRFRTIGAGTMPDGRAVVISAVVLLAGIGASQMVRLNPKALRAYPAEVLTLDGYASYFDDPEFRREWRYDQCHLDNRSGGFRAYDPATCLTGTVADGRHVLLIGDSHGAHIWHALDTALGGGLMQATSTNCRPLIGNSTGNFCGRMSNFILTEWIPEHRPDVVVLSGNWRDAELPSLADTIAQIRASGVGRVIVLGDTIAYGSELPKILARNALGASDRAQAYLRPGQWERNALVRSAVEQAGGTYIDLLEVLCPDHACRTWLGDSPMLFDSNHYTSEGATFVANSIVDDI